MSKYSIAIHGGAGTILPEEMTRDLERQFHGALEEALGAGKKVLENGGKAADAVVASVEVLEECPLFNAGKGAVFAHNGRHILEASIMDGATQDAGAVAGLQHIRNPIRLARAVMEKSQHVMLIGAGAEAFAREHNLEFVGNEWFSTDFRKRQLALIRDSQEVALDHSVLEKQKKFGTVGAVARDQFGNLAAATSTGGVTNKRWGRVGDSPLIGCGTYAENGVAAVSATGYGEAFIRRAVAHDLIARMKYGQQTLEQAGHGLVHQELLPLGGEGGLIAVDAHGNISMPFNSDGMYRGYATADQFETLIYQP